MQYNVAAILCRQCSEAPLHNRGKQADHTELLWDIRVSLKVCSTDAGLK